MASKKTSAEETRLDATTLRLLDELAEVFATLGSAPRLRILYLLQGNPDLTVGEVSDQTGIAISGVSTHIQRLRRSGLVHCRRDGQSVCCTLQGKSRHIGFVRAIFKGIAEGKSCC